MERMLLSDAHKLKKAGEFSSVFVFRKVRVGDHLKLHYMPNGLAHSRLGLIVSKKIAKRANRRNYMKRLLRELFRTQSTLWGGVDLVVRVTRAFKHEDFAKLKAEFINLTLKFQS